VIDIVIHNPMPNSIGFGPAALSFSMDKLQPIKNKQSTRVFLAIRNITW
jgi:hypothetical protein